MRSVVVAGVVVVLLVASILVVSREPPIDVVRVTIDAETTYQTIDGFGCGIKRRTELLTDANTDVVLRAAFRDLHLNAIRFFVYHHELEDGTPDFTPYETRRVLDVLRKIPDIATRSLDICIANCNSAPPSMKTNGSHRGDVGESNTLKEGYETSFADFLREVVVGLRDRGVHVTHVSPTNEPDFEVLYESMNLTPAQCTRVLREIRNRMTDEDVFTLSPECFRVESETNPDRSTTNYVRKMLEYDSETLSALVDVVGTHTYDDLDHDAKWENLRDLVDTRPIFVTESANLRSPDRGIEDARHYALWILRGFRYGAVSAYMVHLLFENAETETSALVLWDETTESIVLPKRYFVLKHFANLTPPGSTRVEVAFEDDAVVGEIVGFRVPSSDRIVVIHIFAETSKTLRFSERILEHYVTSSACDFERGCGVGSSEIRVEAMSLHSLVITIT